jgi:transketolase
VYSGADRMDAMAVTNRARRLMSDWIDLAVSGEYTLSSDWDDRWRTGGTVDEVIAEAHLSADHIFEGIRRFASERKTRLDRIRGIVESIEETRG